MHLIEADEVSYFFLRPIPRTYFHVRPQMAWLGFIFLYLLNTQEHHFNVSGFNLFFPNSYTREGENHLNKRLEVNADRGNRTPASWVTSKCAIHYTIASRANLCQYERHKNVGFRARRQNHARYKLQLISVSRTVKINIILQQ